MVQAVKFSCPLKKGYMGCRETSVTNYHNALLKIPEERRVLFTPQRKAAI